MRLLAIADGFGDSISSPSWYADFLKWPNLINLMTRRLEFIDLARYGAGNEYMLQCLRNNYQDSDVVLIQWAIPNRLDLLLQNHDSFWRQEISQDPVYNKNIVSVGKNQYWLSSASKNLHVQQYHQKYINIRQHQVRSQTYIEHAKLLLETNFIKYGFLLTSDSDYLRESVPNTSNWHWHSPFKGMDSFRRVSKFADLDFGLVQPISLVQFDFVKQFIMPNFDLPWRSDRDITAVENMLHRKHKEALAAKNK